MASWEGKRVRGSNDVWMTMALLPGGYWTSLGCFLAAMILFALLFYTMRRQRRNG